jgi:catechol 2,3-dioxygenase-like lactoylglutathione lyase family enzyme
MADWFARPILNVTDVETSLRFYIDRLGFTVAWRYEENDKARIAQVDGFGCELILAESWPERIGKGLTFVSLNLEPVAQIARLDALRVEVESKGIPVREALWGYRVLIIDDPDGNQLLFNYPAESGKDSSAMPGV